jgi:surfeit locus 1 family protein
MIRRLPIIPTLIVAAAIATMIALGVWQIGRAREKEALLALFHANQGRPAMTFPVVGPVPLEAMFRPSSVHCFEVVGWRSEVGRAADRTTGYRHIAECRTGAEGPGALVDTGVARDPQFKPTWKGGEVAGIITTEPDHNSLISKLFRRATVLSPMLVANRGLAGLEASAPPSPADIPNNHRGYAVQWFLFALIAAVIYGLALRGRLAAKPKED